MRRKILVAEDCSDIRELYQDILSRNYDVTLASSAQEALRIFERGLFDLVITDMDTGPGIRGHDLIGHLFAQGHTNVLLVCGEPPQLPYIERKLVVPQEYDYPFEQKPFIPRQLLERVRSLLE